MLLIVDGHWRGGFKWIDFVPMQKNHVSAGIIFAVCCSSTVCN